MNALDLTVDICGIRANLDGRRYVLSVIRRFMIKLRLNSNNLEEKQI
jgi:hypothetical protein